MQANKQTVWYELLVLRCRRRDKEAFEELVAHFQQRLFYYIRRLIDHEEDAWNILQETWLKAFRSMDKLRDGQCLASWLYCIARRTAISHLRSDYVRQAHFVASDESIEPPAAPEDLPLDDVQLVHHGLGQLSLPHREVLTLLFLEDMSVAEIATVLEISAGTVKSRLYHARRALRKILIRETDDGSE